MHLVLQDVLLVRIHKLVFNVLLDLDIIRLLIYVILVKIIVICVHRMLGVNLVRLGIGLIIMGYRVDVCHV